MANTANYGWSKEALTGEVASFPTRLGSVLDSIDTSLETALASKMSYALPTNVQTGTTYTAVLADANKLTTLNNASPIAVTIPPQSSVAWLGNTVLRYTSLGAGVVTFAGGAGVTVTNTAGTLAQYQSADLIRTGSDAWTVLPFGGGSAKATVSGTTGSPTVISTGGKTAYKFTGDGTVTIGVSGYLKLRLAGAGGGSPAAVSGYSASTGGGGGGGYMEQDVWMPAGTYTVKIGTGSAGANGTNTYVGPYVATGGGKGGDMYSSPASQGGSGGGGGRGSGGSSVGATSNSGTQGNAGGNTTNATDYLGGGGGGGAGGAGGSTTTGAAGTAGLGVTSTITGSSETLCAGGLGGSASVTGTGATGGANTGNGAGGSNSTAVAVAGGSGQAVLLIG